MTTTQDIILGITGQSLVFDAPEGRPSSVTSVTVHQAGEGDDGTAESATTGSPAVETNPNTTLDADSGFGAANPRLVNLTATTGCEVGRSYLITGATGITEWVEVVNVSAGVSVSARAPLMTLHASGATFESTRMSVAIDSTWVADDTNIIADGSPNPGYRVRWVYVVDGVTRVVDTYFDLVRYAGRHTVTPAIMANAMPGWFESLPIDHRADQGGRLIDEAYEQVKFDLYSAGFADEQIRERELVDELVRMKAVWVLMRSRFLLGAADPQTLDYTRQEYQARLDAWVRYTLKAPVDTDTTGAGGKPLPFNLLSR